MPVNQAERAAEQIDPGGHDRRADTVVVEGQRLDEVVDVAPMVRGVQHAPGGGGLLRDLDVLGVPVDLAEDGIEGVFQRPVDRIPLRRPELLEVGADPIAHLGLGPGMAAVQVPDDFLAREHRLGDVVEHLVGRHYITRYGCAVVAVGRSNCLSCQAGCHGLSCLIMACRTVSSLCMVAMSATFLVLPAWSRRR